jgi:hypothetical protein
MPDEPHRLALQKLFQIKRRQGDKALQFSFVSKLVGILDERQPIFDQYVQHYLGLGPPSLMALPEFRISGFLRNLAEIRSPPIVTAADGHGGTLIKEAAQTANQLVRSRRAPETTSGLLWPGAGPSAAKGYPLS